MNYQLKNSNNRRRRNPFPGLVGIMVALVLLACLIFIPNTLNAVFLKLISPFWGIESVASDALTSKASLTKENVSLQQRLAALESSEARASQLSQENTELKELLGRTAIKDRLLASVLRKPPFSPYDTVVIDSGSTEGVSIDDVVYALGDIPVGKVTEVTSHTSKVELFSNPGSVYDVIIGKKNIETTATARGGGVYEVVVPRDVEVLEGDTVSIPDIYASTFGTVSTVIAVPAQAFSTVLFKSPVNVSELRWVIVERASSNTF